MATEREEENSRNYDDDQWYTTCAWISLALGSVVFVTSMAALGIILGLELRQGYAVITFIVTSGSLYLISVISTVVYLYSRESHDIHGAPLRRENVLNNSRTPDTTTETIDMELLRQLSAQQDSYPPRDAGTSADSLRSSRSAPEASHAQCNHSADRPRCNRCNEADRTDLCVQPDQHRPLRRLQQLPFSPLPSRRHQPVGNSSENLECIEASYRLPDAMNIPRVNAGQYWSRHHKARVPELRVLEEGLQGQSHIRSDLGHKKHEDLRLENPREVTPGRYSLRDSGENAESGLIYHDIEIPIKSGLQQARSVSSATKSSVKDNETLVKDIATSGHDAASSKSGHNYVNVKYGQQKCSASNAQGGSNEMSEGPLSVDTRSFSEDQLKAWQNFMEKLPDTDRAIIMGMRM